MNVIKRMSILALLGFLALIVKCKAIQHAVGGSQGWDPSADLNSWASGQTFKVGDHLVFKYSAGLHSVVELASESAYKNCNIGSAKDTMNSGNDDIKLTNTGTRYFACGNLGHCDQGMKLKITVLSSNESATTATSSPPSSTSYSSATSFRSFNFFFRATSLLLLVPLLFTNIC